MWVRGLPDASVESAFPGPGRHHHSHLGAQRPEECRSDGVADRLQTAQQPRDRRLGRSAVQAQLAPHSN